MSNIKERLERGLATLERLERRRRETGSPRWGYDTECLIVSHELRQIESDLLDGTCEAAPNLFSASPKSDVS